VFFAIVSSEALEKYKTERLKSYLLGSFNIHNSEPKLKLLLPSLSLQLTQSNVLRQSNQMLIKPSNSLQERLLLRILLYLLACIASQREAMRNSTVKVDLVWLLGGYEDLFGLVALLGREDGVGFCGGDGDGTVNGAELGFFDETGGS
jgi:hypothetical protein